MVDSNVILVLMPASNANVLWLSVRSTLILTYVEYALFRLYLNLNSFLPYCRTDCGSFLQTSLYGKERTLPKVSTLDTDIAYAFDCTLYAFLVLKLETRRL